MAIEEDYEGHHITASAVVLVDSGQWQPRFVVTELNEDPTLITPRTIKREFPTQAEAEREAMLFAKNGLMMASRRYDFHTRTCHSRSALFMPLRGCAR